MPLKLYRRKGSDIWSYRGTVAGVRLRGSTKTASKEIAQQIILDIETRQWKGAIHGPESVLTFAQAAMLYRAAGKPDRFLRAIEDYWKDTLVKNVTAGAVRQSALVLYPTAGGATRNRNVIVPTQAIINHAAELGHCQPLAVKRFDFETKERNYVTREWCETFMAHSSPHLGALCCFMLATGARITEAINLRWRDVDLTGRSVLIRQTKVGSERRNHIPRTLLVAIANIEGERRSDGKVFKYSSRETARHSWNDAVRRAGLEHRSFHACRHGFATALLRAGVDVNTVAKLGGWKTPALVLSTYGHANDDPTLTERIFDTQNDRRTENHNAVI